MIPALPGGGRRVVDLEQRRPADARRVVAAVLAEVAPAVAVEPEPVADQRDAEARLIGDGEPAVLRERLALEQAVKVADDAVQLGRDELGPAGRTAGKARYRRKLDAQAAAPTPAPAWPLKWDS